MDQRQTATVTGAAGVAIVNLPHVAADMGKQHHDVTGTRGGHHRGWSGAGEFSHPIESQIEFRTNLPEQFD